MERLTEEQIESMREMLIGKKVQIRGMAGICHYFGYNEHFPTWDLQITINRTPIPRVKLSELVVM
jgi:hypothetical protein